MTPNTQGPPPEIRKALAAVATIDRLEVGPTRIEPERVTTPYRVHRGGAVDETELVYRYEEPVFDPADPGSQNLAAMVTAQVALNYGMFCRELVFHGPFDRHDRQFLANYAAHTAREIFVNKLLANNPFLTGLEGRLPTARLATYLQASLRFEGPSADQVAATTASDWKPERARHAVLSSGGKDSLLTWGLLEEVGVEAHPIFINESGRHWFSALNAHRDFAERIPNTARVWTSSDRLFNWMLRHLPFVRPDFARVRADDYPIRLWTVAVFLFGALPLLRKRGIGRLLIGNEHDTTVRSSQRGITHYHGLFDQSRWFDDAMSRYFRRKRWGVVQFSLLRPLSELLIEKILVERYPHLLRLQVSCHAAHTEGAVVNPCGRCEKCRRIVGTLTALGADPAQCGYDPQQVADCLAALVAQGVHQEQAGARHLMHLLAERGAIAAGSRAGRHPEIEQLRFDPERSPIEAIPQDLREPVLRRMLEHANGAVERKGRDWVAFDPLSPQNLGKPHPFEREETSTSGGGEEPTPGVLLGELTWPEAERRFREVDIALLPVGALEQHGPHLPLDTDAYDALRLAQEVAAACTSPHPLVLPLIPYGVSYHHDDFAGTFSISPDTLARLVIEVGASAVRNGVTKLVIVNGHGGNSPALHFAAQVINRDFKIFTCVDTGETSDADVDAIAETHNDVHAGEIETSTSLALRPELVHMDRAEAAVPRFSSHYLDFSSSRSVGWYAYTKRISPTGVMGDPTKATRDKGIRMWQAIVRNLVELVEDLKSMSLDEIHQRRY